jgi:hypothetical protein
MLSLYSFVYQLCIASRSVTSLQFTVSCYCRILCAVLLLMFLATLCSTQWYGMCIVVCVYRDVCRVLLADYVDCGVYEVQLTVPTSVLRF